MRNNKTDHGQEIRAILHNSEAPVVELNSYIEQQLRKADKWWTAVCMLMLLASIYAIFHTKPPRKEVVKEARILVDSMRIEYQAKMDFKLDSIYNTIAPSIRTNYGLLIPKR